jgi:hypothetical protein
VRDSKRVRVRDSETGRQGDRGPEGHMKTIRALVYEVAARDAAWPLLPIVVVIIDTGEIV